VTRSADVKTGVRFWVLELGGGGSREQETIQTVKLALKPVVAGRQSVRITKGSEESPLGRGVDQTSGGES